MDLTYKLTPKHKALTYEHQGAVILSFDGAGALCNELMGLLKENLANDVKSITISGNGLGYGLGIDFFSVVVNYFGNRKIKIYFEDFDLPKTNFRGVVGQVELRNHHEVLNHGLIASLSFLRTLDSGMRFNSNPPISRAELVSTHDCPRCNATTFCAVTAGKSLSACHCHWASAKRFMTLDEIDSDICLCHKCLTQ